MTSAPDIPRLEAAFNSLAGRMAGAPGYNAALTVVAAGFRPWRGGWVGAVVTPWAVQLLLLSGIEQDESAPAPGERRIHLFPGGEWTLMGLNLEGYGMVQAAPLLASVAGLETQAQAESAALAAFHQVMAAEGAGFFASARSSDAPSQASEKRAVSRRDFLRGRLFGR